MLLTKVQKKAEAMEHQHARLEATHEIIRNLLLSDEDEDEEDEEDLLEYGGEAGTTPISRSMMLEEATTTTTTTTSTVHIGTGVTWTTFGLMVAFAASSGFVVESARIRIAAARDARRQSYTDIVEERTAGAMDQVAEAIATNVSIVLQAQTKCRVSAAPAHCLTCQHERTNEYK